jgi:hypothetical protein
VLVREGRSGRRRVLFVHNAAENGAVAWVNPGGSARLATDLVTGDRMRADGAGRFCIPLAGRESRVWTLPRTETGRLK